MTLICGLKLPVITVIIYDSIVTKYSASKIWKEEVDKRDSFRGLDIFCAFNKEDTNCYEKILSYLRNEDEKTEGIHNLDEAYENLNNIIKEYGAGTLKALLFFNSILTAENHLIIGKISILPKPNSTKKIKTLLSKLLGINLYIFCPTTDKGLKKKYFLLITLSAVILSIVLRIKNFIFKCGGIDADEAIKEFAKIVYQYCGLLALYGLKQGGKREIVYFPFRFLISIYYNDKEGLCWIDNREDVTTIDNKKTELCKEERATGFFVNRGTFKPRFYKGVLIHKT